MPEPSSAPGPALALLQGLVREPLRRHWALGVGLGGGLLLLEASHGPLSSLLSLAAATTGVWVLRGRLRPRAPQLPTSVAGWLERCEAVLASFERLQPSESSGAEAVSQQQRRQAQLQRLRQRQAQQQLQLALVGSDGWSEPLQARLLAQLHCPLPLQVHRSHPLPAASEQWQWPELFRQCDLLLYRLELPLKAMDLRWLEALPEGLTVRLLVERPAEGAWPEWQQQLDRQLPARLRGQVWPWCPQQSGPWTQDLQPLNDLLAGTGSEQLLRNQQRCLHDLHAAWQLELEQLRRQHWQRLVQRTQWTVAAGVVVAPLPSLDLLVLTAANGLMLQEMAKLWDCAWSLDQLQAAARELAKAALTQGVVEWSSQSLAALVKLHGATWLVGSALQALSAAYLTRVVGRAMADYLALAAGVPEAELEALLQRQGPLLVARAADQERLDWGAFLQQGRQWLQQQQPLLPTTS